MRKKKINPYYAGKSVVFVEQLIKQEIERRKLAEMTSTIEQEDLPRPEDREIPVDQDIIDIDVEEKASKLSGAITMSSSTHTPNWDLGRYMTGSTIVYRGSIDSDNCENEASANTKYNKQFLVQLNILATDDFSNDCTCEDPLNCSGKCKPTFEELQEKLNKILVEYGFNGISNE